MAGLFKATRSGDLAGVEEALRNGANVDGRSPEWACHETCLHAASRNGHFAIVRVLLDAGADTEARDTSEGTPLHDACAHGRLEVVRELVRRGADIFAKTRHGSTPFDLSVQSLAGIGHPFVAEFLLQHYRETIYESEGRRSLLTILKQGDFLFGQGVALQIGRRVSMDQLLSMLRYFVEHDPDCIHERDHNGDLPLHVACRKPGLFQAMQYLVEQDPGALHILNNHGALPIHLACGSGASLRAIKYLVEENGGAGTIFTCDSNGALPLHFLCGSTEATLETIEYLTNAHPAAVWTQNNHGALPLHALCGTPDPSLVAIKRLVNAHPSALSTRTSTSGDLPITLAGESASLDVIYTLIRGCPEVVPS